VRDAAAYDVFPDRDAGADPAVPAEQGGHGFRGDGWETNTSFDLIGDPHAVRGGAIRFQIADFPATLRLFGPESNTAFNDTIRPLVWETLLRLHPSTSAWVPALATHWQISPDRRTFRFRLDPNARFANGQPVTTDDVVATWRFLVDSRLQDPRARVMFGRFEPPAAESKYIVRVASREPSWQDFIAFAGDLPILPAGVLKTIDGSRYLTDFNFTPLPGSGPYVLDQAGIQKGQRLTLHRRSDYWADNYRRNAGLHNFDEIHAVVLRDPSLAIEAFKRGDVDYQVVTSSRQWVQSLDIEQVRRGLIQRRKIFTDAPLGIQGLAFNTRRAPWNDIRVRQALAHLVNRELLIEKFFFREYTPQNSFFAGGEYENPHNPRTPYDPQLALSLLADAGWRHRDSEGRLVKHGRPLVVELVYAQQTPETLFRLVMDRQFNLAVMGWSEDRFPVPQTLFGSALADRPDTNNITGFKSSRVDALIAAYEKEFDPARRAALIRDIDGIATREYHYILLWNMPFRRVAYWNRFGHPSTYLTRTGPASDLLFLWWHDRRAADRLDAARRHGSTLPVGSIDQRPWR
jgi:microcin C transport system substrate-binding protein